MINKEIYLIIVDTNEHNDDSYTLDTTDIIIDVFTMFIKKNGKIQYLKLINLLNIANKLFVNKTVHFPKLKYKNEPLTVEITQKLVESLLYNCNVVF